MTKASNSKKSLPKKPATNKKKTAKNDGKDCDEPAEKPKVCQLEWGHNADWTHHAIEYLTANITFCHWLFSDATLDAKAEDRKKVTASENKTALYGTLAAAIFNWSPAEGEHLSEDEEALKVDYLRDPAHFRKSTQQQFQRFAPC